MQRTFHSFLIGQAAPHPRRFTRPETVRSRASARVHSGQSRSSTPPPTEPLPQVTPSDSTLMGVMGVSDWQFLKPPGLEEKEGQRHPSLDDFDGELAVFQGVLERLGGIEETTAVGWLIVNQSPAKNALSSLASKWKTVYAGHLEQQVCGGGGGGGGVWVHMWVVWDVHVCVVWVHMCMVWVHCGMGAHVCGVGCAHVCGVGAHVIIHSAWYTVLYLYSSVRNVTTLHAVMWCVFGKLVHTLLNEWCVCVEDAH